MVFFVEVGVLLVFFEAILNKTRMLRSKPLSEETAELKHVTALTKAAHILLQVYIVLHSFTSTIRQHTPAYVRIRQHTSAYVHTSLQSFTHQSSSLLLGKYNGT